MKFNLTLLALILAFGAISQNQITQADLKTIIGSWEGSIIYIDYQTNKPFTMPANLIVKQGKNENTLVLNNIYPKEPKANNSEKIKISKNGLLLNGHTVSLKKELENGAVQIQTEHLGKDANKKALIRYTYIFGNDLFLIRKEVKFTKEEWIKRNEFTYIRKK